MKAPPSWTNQDLKQDFDERYRVDEATTSVIERLLQSTFKSRATRDRKDDMPEGLKLLKVQRVEDRKMWVRYLRAKAQLKAKRRTCTKLANLKSSGYVKTLCGRSWFFKNMDHNLNEFYLWHGTSPEGAMGISEDGFDLSRAGATGLMFGRGVYLAECSSKSDEYASEGKSIYQDTYALLLCRAACGEMFHIEEPNRVLIEAAMRTGDYDSVLGDREKVVGTYREFVLPDADLVYPEFVVLYERVRE